MRTLNLLCQDYQDDELNGLLMAAKLLNWKIGDWSVYRDALGIEIQKEETIITIYIMIENNQYDKVAITKHKEDKPGFDFDKDYNYQDKNKAFKKVIKWL